jgi:hypothetical protein
LTLDSDLALQVFWGRSAQLLMGFHHLFFPGLYYYVHTEHGGGGIFKKKNFPSEKKWNPKEGDRRMNTRD